MVNRMLKLNTNRKTHKHENGQQQERNGRLVDLREVVKTYQSSAGTFTALKGVDLQVESGAFVSIIGRSGSGKSTLINVITGIDRPTSGQVSIDGVDIHMLNEERIAIWRGRSIGVIFQFFQLLPTLTAVENSVLSVQCTYSSWWGWQTGRTGSRIRFPAGSSNVWPLPGRWRTIRFFSRRMSQPATWIQNPPKWFSISLRTWPRQGRRSSWSPTITIWLRVPNVRFGLRMAASSTSSRTVNRRRRTCLNKILIQIHAKPSRGQVRLNR
jgi:ABC-type sugar transport system ATPase subunit